MNFRFTCPVLVAGLLLTLATSSIAQSRSVLEGVYTERQADRGERPYERICAECHEGDEPDADPIIGLNFVERWREAPLDFLYNFISTEMPGDEPGELDSETYLEVLAFLLQANDYPAGDEELKPENLDSILFTGLDGPQPIPLYSLVKVVGCMQSGTDWALVGASPLMRVRTADETTAAELAKSAQLPAGEASYSLRNAADFDPGASRNSKVQVKGVLNSHDASPSITVLSLEQVTGACG